MAFLPAKCIKVELVPNTDPREDTEYTVTWLWTSRPKDVMLTILTASSTEDALNDVREPGNDDSPDFGLV